MWSSPTKGCAAKRPVTTRILRRETKAILEKRGMIRLFGVSIIQGFISGLRSLLWIWTVLCSSTRYWSLLIDARRATLFSKLLGGLFYQYEQLRCPSSWTPGGVPKHLFKDTVRIYLRFEVLDWDALNLKFSSIILIPGVGTALPSTWFGLRGQSLPEMFPNCNIPSPVLYQFDHGLNLELESRLWDNILDKGKALLEELMGLLNNKVKAFHQHCLQCCIPSNAKTE